MQPPQKSEQKAGVILRKIENRRYNFFYRGLDEIALIPDFLRTFLLVYGELSLLQRLTSSAQQLRP